MTLSRLKELSNNSLTDAQLLAIKEEVKAECVDKLQVLAFKRATANDFPYTEGYLQANEEAIQTIKEV